MNDKGKSEAWSWPETHLFQPLSIQTYIGQYRSLTIFKLKQENRLGGVRCRAPLVECPDKQLLSRGPFDPDVYDR
jgi:hypothetical protein